MIGAMRWIKSVWQRHQSTLPALLFGAMALMFLEQFYWAFAAGTVEFPHSSGEWISYQSNPLQFIVSLIIYGLCFLVCGAISALGIWGAIAQQSGLTRWSRKRRSRDLLDDAIRQSRDDR